MASYLFQLIYNNGFLTRLDRNFRLILPSITGIYVFVSFLFEISFRGNDIALEKFVHKEGGNQKSVDSFLELNYC